MSTQPPYPQQPYPQQPYPQRPPQWGGEPSSGFPAWTPPPQPPKGGFQLTPKVLAIISGVVVALVLAIVLVVALTGDDDATRTTAQSDTGSIRGSRDDWLAAVCRDGSFLNGSESNFTNATATAQCIGRRSGDGIMIAEFDSQYTMQNDMKLLHVGTYASATKGDKEIAFASYGPDVGQGKDLAVLKEFGFTVTHT